MRVLLRYRIVALTVLCLAPVVAASSFALVRLATRYFWEEAEKDAISFADTVRRSTRHAMLTLNRAELEAILNAVARQPGVYAVRLYDGDGRFRLPRQEEPLGTATLQGSCAGCHPGREGLPLPPRGCTHRLDDGLRLYYPIPPEPECLTSSCHAGDAAHLLGVLEVHLDVSRIAAQEGDLARQAALWGLVVLAAAVLPLFLAFGWTVGRPLAESVRLVREISAGNLEARSRLERSDEWRELLGGFDAMASTLADTRAELETLNRDLERQVQKRTRDLEIALGAARESDRMKTEFLAGISHELSTPLHAVIGYAELLLDGIEGELNPEQQRDLEVILRNGRILLRRVEDLLQLARLEGKQFVLCVDRVSLGEVAAEVVEAGRRLASGKPVEVALEATPGCPPVSGEPRALRHILFHLVENAVRHTSRGRVTLSIREAGPGWAEVTVADTGPGTEPEVLQAALQGFVPKEGGGGMGLGLSLVRRLTELHGGTLSVSSRPGRGTCIRVRLPAAREPETSTA